jgi:CRISPR/Cas system-associated exonuclease Cas4 (RecB family)
MGKPILLDQTALATFEACPRRFQLRYLERLPWPSLPLDRKQSLAVERGRYFHRLVERSMLGLPVDSEGIDDDVVRGWWGRFVRSGPALPEGERWPEHRLTIPIGNNYLTGRFDLLVLGEDAGRPFASLFDWKTSKPRSATELEKAWQTRLYLALLAEGGAALSKGRQPLTADRISLTYWYPGEPDEPRVIPYSEAKHQQNWAQIEELAATIEALDSSQMWTLTDDWNHCRSCLYQTYCGRQEAGKADMLLAEEEEPYEIEQAVLLEPQTP